MTSLSLDHVIRRFYIYRCTTATGFVSAFLVAFLVENNIPFTTISLGLTAMSIVNILGEVPAGYFGDKFGRRISMVTASILTALTATGWIFAQNAASVVVLYGLVGVTLSLRSGSTTSWLYDTLDEYDATARQGRIESRSLSLMRATTGGTMLLGAGLYVISPKYAFGASALAGVIGVVSALSLPTNEHYREQGDDTDRVSPRQAFVSLVSFLQKPAVRTVVIFCAISAAAVVVASRYIQPIIDEAAKASGITIAGNPVPGVIVLGLVGLIYTSISAVAVDYADTLERRLGTGRAIILVYGTSAAVMIVPAMASYIPVSLVLIAALANIVFQSLPNVAAPIRNTYLHEHVDSVERATMMSSVMFAYSLARIPFVLAAGVIADAYSAPVALAIAGASALVLGTSLILVDGPFAISDDHIDEAPSANEGHIETGD